MSVSSLSTSPILSPSYSLGLPQANAAQAASPSPNGATSSGQNQDSTNATSAKSPEKVSAQITQVTSQPNANGTLTVQTQFADGTSKTSIQPNLKPVTVASLFASTNAGQLATLLAAQEQSQQPAAAT